MALPAGMAEPEGWCATWPRALLLYLLGDRGRVAGVPSRVCSAGGRRPVRREWGSLLPLLTRSPSPTPHVSLPFPQSPAGRAPHLHTPVQWLPHHFCGASHLDPVSVISPDSGLKAQSPCHLPPRRPPQPGSAVYGGRDGHIPPLCSWQIT